MLNIIYVGFEKDCNQKTISELVGKQAILKLKHIAAERFGGYSATIVQGGWINGAGILVEEKALRLEIVTDDVTGIKAITATAKAMLNQESILLVQYQAEATF
jgi:hypothetical protein